MTHSEAHDDAITTAQALTGALERMSDELAQVRAYGRRSRRIIIALTAFGCVDIVVTILVTLLAVLVNATADQAAATVRQLHQTQIAACEIGNQTLAKQVLLWDHIVSITLTPATPAKQRKEVEQLLVFVRQTFARRNCPQIYRLPS